ncbi:hypothetical protein AwPolaro_08830 [Polaromonas sp.]|nr:hypothetical protein AwPolaro_08830 [Polaromonas sp.]
MQDTAPYQTIRVDASAGIAHIQLCRPERLNALSNEILLKMDTARGVGLQAV